ncbi:MAG TPA: sugar ABC transporter substrate-binding protein [Pseudolysinimonas sp.]|jgi:multiple sugar transport system substrate-binding protein|nr:sugar ABC transporter substrate-binding protein [Pseudolysinimonas sp.]
MKKSLLATAGLVGAAAVVLAGCTASGGGDEGPVTITYTNFISNDGNEDNLQKIVDAFEKANPDITVDVTTLPYADYGTALQTDLAAGTESDVFDIEYANYAQYQANGVLAPITVQNPDAYKQSLLEAYATDGTQYALPSSFSDVVLYYNKDLFDAAGLDYPNADWTWADEKAAAEKLTDKAAGVWGDHQPVSFYEYYKALAQNGGQFLSDDGTKVAFNTPAGVEAAHWLVDKSGTVMPTIEQGQGTPDFDTNLFKDGKLAMMHTGIWVFGAVADVPFGWDIAVEPGNTTQASAVFSNALGVSANSKHPEAAAKWAEFLSSSDTTVQVRLDAGWELPPISDDAKLSTYLEKGAPENRQAVFDSLDGIALPPVVATGQTEMQDIMTEELVEAQAGRKSVEDALKSAEERINAAIAG